MSYQLNERKLDRLLASLNRIGQMIDQSPYKEMVMGHPEAKEFTMALVDVQNEVHQQTLIK